MRVKQALFLVGGRGTRLGALSANVPKPMQEIAPGLRFLDLLLENAGRHGFTDIILLAGHLGDQVEAAYHGRTIRGAHVRVVREPSPQGTGGALSLVSGLLESAFLLANGDSFFDFNLRALAAEPLGDDLGRLALRHVPDAGRYGSVQVADKTITAFLEKDPAQTGPGLINGGVYLLNRAITQLLSAPSSLEMDIFPRLVASRQLQGMMFDGYFLDIGLPETLAQAKAETASLLVRPAVVFDRDGVLNEDTGYTHRADHLIWQPGAREAIRLLNDRGYYVFVATNQAGVARGFYEEAAIETFHDHMQNELAAVGAHIDAFYHCPFHPNAIVERYRADDHPDRKPNPGMLMRALSEWPVDRSRSFMIGDRESDIAAARGADLPGHLYEGGNLADLVARLIG